MLDALPLTAQNVNVISAAEAPSADSLIGSILIVDDDRSVAETFARMLQLEGFSVATALDPSIGLELADRIQPKAIILDMRMPIINGIQFLRQLRARPHLADVPVAIVTGDYFLSDALQQELTNLGASLRFKPLWLEDLVALAKALVVR
jgi:DNA-binding response OmpR family regulator